MNTRIYSLINFYHLFHRLFIISYRKQTINTIATHANGSPMKNLANFHALRSYLALAVNFHKILI